MFDDREAEKRQPKQFVKFKVALGLCWKALNILICLSYDRLQFDFIRVSTSLWYMGEE